MAKKLNKKVAVIGIVFLVLIVLGGAALAWRQFYHRDPERNLEIARQAAADGDYERAEKAFGRAYAFGKSDAFKIDRLFEMAEFHLIHNEQHEANWPKAVSCWRTVLNIAPKNVPARQKMLQYFYDMADSGTTAAWKNVHDDAKELIEIDKAKGEEVDTKLLEAFGRACLSIAQQGGTTNRKEFLDQALSSFETLVQQEPGTASHYSYLADAILLEGVLTEQSGVMGAGQKAQTAALEKLDEAITKADDKAEAQATRFGFDLQLVGNDPNGVEALRAKMEDFMKGTSPSPRFLTILSQAYELPGNSDAKSELNRAIEAAQQARRLAPDEFEYGYRMALLLYRKGSAFGDEAAMADAIALVEELKKSPQAQDVPGPRQGRNLAYRNALNVFLVERYLDKAFAHPEEAETWTQKAEPLINQIRQYFGGSSEHRVVQQWEGILALAKGKQDAGVRLLYRAYEQAKAQDAPDQPSTIDPALCVALARVAQQEGQIGLQREFLEKALRNRTRIVLSKPSLLLDYAELIARFQTPQTWQQVAILVNGYQQRYGANEQSKILFTNAALALGDEESVKKAIAALPESSLERKSLEIRFVTSQIAGVARQITGLEQEGKKIPEETRKKLDTLRSHQRQLLLEMIEADPDKIDTGMLYSVSIYDLNNQKEAEAKALLGAYLARKPDAFLLKVLRKAIEEPDHTAIPAERYAEIQMEIIETLSTPKLRALAKAELFQTKGDYEKAMEMLKEAATADKDDDGDVVQQQFDLAIDNEDIKTAEDLLRTMRTRNLDGCEGNVSAAQVELLKKNYSLALRRLEEALTLKPLNSFAHFLKSRIYEAMDNTDEALKSCQQAMEMNLLSGQYAKNYASLLFKRNTALGARVTPTQQNELVQVIERAMALNPTDWQLQSVYAEVISNQTPDQAIAIRQRLLQSRPNVANAIMLGNLALRMVETERDPAKKTGLIELSGKAYIQALQIDPDNEEARAAYANYLSQTRQTREAEAFLQGDKNLLWRYYLQNSQFDRAEELLIRLHREDAKDASVVRGLVLTSEGKGNRINMKKYLDVMASLELDKDNELWLLQKYLDAGYADEVDHKLASFKERHPQEKVALLLEAWSKMTKGQLSEALTLTNSYLESTSENAGAWRLRGRLYRLMNEPRKAIDDLQRSKSITPNAAISLELATIYSEIGQVDAAIGELVNGLASPQAPMQMRSMLESLYQRNKRFSDLEKFYTQTLEKFPDDPYWSMQAGKFYLSQKNNARAVSALKNAWEGYVRQNVPNPTAFSLYFEAMIQNRQYNDAFTLASGLVDGPLAPLAYGYMAQSQFQQGQKEKAEDLFFAALDRSQGSDAIQEKLLSMMLATVGKESAVRWSQKYSEALPNLLLSYRLAVMDEQYNRGIEMIDKCLSSVRPSAPEWTNFALKKANLLVMAYSKTADKEYMSRAVTLFKQRLERYPDNPSVLNNLAYMLTVNDDQLDQALEYARQAHQKEPGNPVYLDTYAFAQYKNGKFEEAQQNLLRAMQLTEISQEPIPWDMYNHLGLVQEKLGHIDKAIDSYRKAMDAEPKAPEKELNEIQDRLTKLKQQAGMPG